MAETFHKMSAVDRVNGVSENVFSINAVKEEATMSLSVYLYTKYHAWVFLIFFLSVLAINFSSWNLRRLNFSFLFTTYHLHYSVLYFIIDFEFRTSKKKYWRIFMSRLK